MSDYLVRVWKVTNINNNFLMYFENVFIKSNIFHINIYNINDLKKFMK